MNHISLILFLGSLVTLNSCSSNTNKSEINKNFNLISSSYTISEKTQNQFSHKLTEALVKLKSDDNLIIDTKEIEAALDSARESNKSRKILVDNVPEMDNAIKFKEKYMQYLKALSLIYDNEFPKCIAILKSHETNRFELVSNILLQKLKDIKNLGDQVQEANHEIQSKYGLSIETSNTE